MFLRIGEPVRSAKFARFVDVDRESTRYLLSADSEALDFRTAPGLALTSASRSAVRRTCGTR
jgi:hypothetical protein